MTVMIVCAFLPPDQNGDSFRGDLNLHASIISETAQEIHEKYDFVSCQPYLIFAAVNVLSLIFYKKFVPETKHDSLEELEMRFEKEFS